jgi:hypothetical protein
MAAELKVQEATAKRSSMKSAKEGPTFKDAPPSPSKDEKKHKEHHHKDKEGSAVKAEPKAEPKADVISPEAKPKKDLPKEGKPKDSPTEGVKRASVKGVHLQGDDEEPEEAAASPSAPAVKYPAISPESIPADVIAKVKTWKVRQAAMHGGKGKTTSKTHPFKPPASFQEALDFLKSQSVKSCTLIFTNNSAIGFADGKYMEFDNFEEEDDE